jgi:hypothetical protein
MGCWQLSTFATLECMSKPFRDARLKIKRADKHIADLDAVIVGLKDSYSSTVEPNRETGHQDLIHAIPEFAEALDTMSLIAGDAIHNLKTALDFAWMGTLKEHVPSANFGRTKFPVYASKKELEAALNGIPINTTANSAIFHVIATDIQPYEGGKHGVVYPLHRLDIEDKHLLLLGLLPLAGIDGIIVENPEGESFAASAEPRKTSRPTLFLFREIFISETRADLPFT